MGKRVIICLVNLLMLLGPVLLPAYRSFIKMQYARLWRARQAYRRGRDLTDLTLSKSDYGKYREGRHEIWVGSRLYDIESMRVHGDSVDLQLEYDPDESRELLAVQGIQKHTEEGRQQNNTSIRWLHWLSELVAMNQSPTLPACINNFSKSYFPFYTSVIHEGYQWVTLQPPDDLVIS